MLLDGRAQETGVIRRGEDSTILIVYNAHHDVVNFTLPSISDGRSWEMLVDTNAPNARSTMHKFDDIYAATGRSMLLFGLATTGSGDLGPVSVR